MIRLFGWFKVPLLWYLSPQVVYLDEDKCQIKIPLNRRSKNHLNSMYFGALCAGADCAGGFYAMKLIIKSKKTISLAFKDFTAEFHKRAEGDTIFECNQGREIRDFVEQVIESKERMEKKITIVATCPEVKDASGRKILTEPVATFTLTLSLKLRE